MTSLREKIATSLILGAINAILTGAAFVSLKTSFTTFAAIWVLAFLLPLLAVTAAMSIRDALKPSLRLQALIAVLLSIPSVMWISSVHLG